MLVPVTHDEAGKTWRYCSVRPLRYFKFRGHKFVVHHPFGCTYKGWFVVSQYSTGRLVSDSEESSISDAILKAKEKMKRVSDARFFELMNMYQAVNKA